MKEKRMRKRTAAEWGILVILAGAFLVMLVFNWLTPLISDDFTYKLICPGKEQVTCVGDIFVSQWNHYQLVNGRAPAHFLVQLFLLLHKGLFNFLNAAMFCFAAWAVAKLAAGQKKLHPMLLLVSFGLLVHFHPCFGAADLWLTGSVGYLWTQSCCLAFLLFYRLEWDRPLKLGKWAPATVFLLGVLAGWSNENIGGAALLASLAFLVLQKLYHKKVPVWEIAGVIGCMVGLTLLLAAPGQWRRMGNMGEDPRGFVTIFLTRVMNATHTLWLYGAVPVVAFGALYFSLWMVKSSPKARTLPLVYFVVALAANYAMILSPVYYVRSFVPVLFYLTAAILACLQGLAEVPASGSKMPMTLAAGGLAALLCFDLLVGGYDIASYYMMRKVRDGLVIEANAQGEELIETYAVFPYTRFCGAWGQPDIRQDEKHWPNDGYAAALKVAPVRATEQAYYPFPGFDEFSNTVEKEMSLELE